MSTAAGGATALLLALGLAVPAGAAGEVTDPEPVIAEAVPVEAEREVVELTPAEVPEGLPAAAEVTAPEGTATPETVPDEAPEVTAPEGTATPEAVPDETATAAAEETATAAAEEAATAAAEETATAAAEEAATAAAEEATTAAPEEPAAQAQATAWPADAEVTTATAPASSGVAVAGVTWEPSDRTAETLAYLRQRTGGTWSEWQAMEVSSLEADGPRTTDGTEPMVVLDAEEVEVALVAPAGADLGDPALTVWDPGTSPADDEADLDAAAGAVAPGGTAVPAAVAMPPTIYTRADWGADESKMTWTPTTGEVTGVVVHHTAGANGYATADVPAIIRGIYHYHAITRDWGDIGYNVLVDRFGRAWEGRDGGITRAVTGAHASGYNGAMFGISVMGDYDKVAVPEAAFDTVARVTAWKFDLHGVSATGRTTVAGRTLNAVVGHLDVAQTACPGRYFYPRLGELTNRISGYQGMWDTTVPRTLDHDLTGDGVADLAFRSGTTAGLWSTEPVPDVTTWVPEKVGHGWTGSRTLSPRDWNGDGTDDLMLLAADGRLWFYAGRGEGRFASRVQIGHGWTGLDLVATGGDWDGDGDADLVARTRGDGLLHLYPGNGRGGFAARTQIGRGWQGMDALTIVEDFDDGRPAVLTRESASGRLIAYPGSGTGAFAGAPVRYGTGWDAMRMLAGAPDLGGPAGTELLAVDGAGSLWSYPVDGAAGIGARTRLATGWADRTALLPTSDGPAVYAVDGAGGLWRHAKVTRPGERTVATSVPMADGDSLVVPGDWDGDGVADLMVRRAGGELILHRGLGQGRYDGAGTRIGHGWAGFTHVVGVGDYLGDGRPGLLTYTASSGALTLYPGNGTGGFGRAMTVTSGQTGYDALVAAGVWDRTSRTPSFLLRGASSKNLFHFPGGYDDRIGARSTIGTGWGGMAAIVGVDDITADGHPDLVAVGTGGGVRLFPGDGDGGFLASRTLGSLPSGATGAA